MNTNGYNLQRKVQVFIHETPISGDVGSYATTAGTDHGSLVLNGATSCALCPVGFFAATSGSVVCNPCSPGYSSFEGQGSCGHETETKSEPHGILQANHVLKAYSNTP